MSELKLDKSNWKPVTFGDVVAEVRTTTKDPIADGIERVVGLEHIEPEFIHLRSWASMEDETTFTKVFCKGHVLFGRRRAYLKKAAVADFDGICSGDITVLKAKSGLLPKLLPFLVNNDKFFDYAVQHSAGGLSPRTKFKDIANYEFLLPPKDQQAKLAELLWAADGAVTSVTELIERITCAKACHFADRIGKASTDGLWPTRKLREFAKIVRGSSPRPAGSPEFFDGDFLPWVTVGLLTNKTNPYLEEHEVASYLTEKGATQTRVIPPDTVILSNSGFSLGVPSILTFEAGANDGIAAFLELQGLDREYLYYYLASLTSYLREQIAAGADQPNLNTSRIGNLSICVPDLETQKEIAAEMLTFDTTANQASVTLNAQQGMLRSLINQIF